MSCRRGMLWFDTAPGERAALRGFLDGTEQHDVHHLPVIKTLEEQRRQECPILVAFQGKCDDAGEEFDGHEGGEEDQGALDILQRPELRKLRDSKLSQSPESKREEK